MLDNLGTDEGEVGFGVGPVNSEVRKYFWVIFLI